MVDRGTLDLYSIAVALVLLPIGLYIDRKNKNTRLDKYKRLGFRFVSELEFCSWVNLSRFSILSKLGVIGRQYEYVMGEYEGQRAGMFALSIANGTNTGIQQTVTVLDAGGNIPPFVARPEWFRDKVKAKFGNTDIDFPEDAEFSNKYFLDGENEADIRRIFTQAVRRKLLDESRLWIQCDGEKLMLFRQGYMLMDGSELERFLRRATEIKSLLEMG